MNRVYEKSSGGIVYKKVAGVIHILLLERKNSRGEREYVLPKGHIENRETAKDTALREIGEETGLDVQDLDIVKFITKINYTFIATYKHGSPIIDKDVYLFLVRYRGTRDPALQNTPGNHEHFTGFAWFSIDALKDVPVKPDIYPIVKRNIPYM